MLSRLRRRWYVLLIGFVLAVGLSVTTWVIFPKTYERTASQVLLPGAGTVPAETNNPYLYLGGLTQAADVVVLAVNSDNVRNEVTREFPGAQYEVTRDSTTSGPVILITASARTDAVADEVLKLLINRTASELMRLQVTDGVNEDDQITIVLVSEDSQGTLKQRTRLVAAVGAGGLFVALTILLAALVEGLRHKSGGRRDEPDLSDLSSSPEPAAPESEPDGTEAVDDSADEAESSDSEEPGAGAVLASQGAGGHPMTTDSG